jgi:hypothetical protein
MDSLMEMLWRRKSHIAKYLCIPHRQWARVISRIECQEAVVLADFPDEQVWTLLLACGYAMAGTPGVAALARQLTECDPRAEADAKIWFEGLPVPPRYKEGVTHVDLALGTIVRRESTESGIALDAAEGAWICFCEMKWYSDVQPTVTNDMQRNQLARVIENALCFQGAGQYAEAVHVTLVTPAVFRDGAVRSRLYQYKFDEYRRDGNSILKDLDACPLEHRNRGDWVYPRDMAQRVRNLSLHWATYDHLFENLPDSPLTADLAIFWGQYGNYQGRV